MTPAQAFDAIVTRFMTTWLASEFVDVPVQIANVRQDPPSDGSPFVRLQVQGVSGQQSAHAPRFQSVELVSLQILSRIGDGPIEALKMADVAKSAFQGQHAGDAWFSNVRHVTDGESGTYYIVRVMADVRYEQRR